MLSQYCLLLRIAHLVDDALAATGGHQTEHISAGHGGLHALQLALPEADVAEALPDLHLNKQCPQQQHNMKSKRKSSS